MNTPVYHLPFGPQHTSVRLIFIEQDFGIHAKDEARPLISRHVKRALQCLRVAGIAYLPAPIKNATQFSG
jgi:uracil-DNA glycosylase